MKKLIWLAPLLLASCYKALDLEGFDKEKWKSFRSGCTDYRTNSVELLITNKDRLLESTQNEIESLLGSPEEHELYERNQKFFHYRLTPHDSCLATTGSIQFLSIRFNAIGRTSDVQVFLREPAQ